MTEPTPTGAERLDLNPVKVPTEPRPPEAHLAPGADTPPDPPSGDDEQ